MNILQKILESFLWKFLEKYFFKIRKSVIILLLVCITFIVGIYLFFTRYEEALYRLSYFFSYREKQIERNINILLLSCHTKGIYIGYAVVDKDIIYFDILRGILTSSKDLTPINTLYLNSFYTIKLPLDSNSKAYLISDEKNNMLSVITYDIAQKNKMIYFIQLFDSLFVHGSLDGVIDTIYITPYIVNGKIVFIVGMSFADSKKISNCNDGTENYNEQRHILFELKKSIANTFK